VSTVKETYMPELFTIQGQETVWGLPSVLRAVRPDKLNKYKWMVDSLSTAPQNLPSLADYTVCTETVLYMYVLLCVLLMLAMYIVLFKNTQKMKSNILHYMYNISGGL